MKEYDYEVRRGETFEGCFWVIDTDDKPVDLDGFSVRGQVRPTREDTVLTKEFHCSIDNTTACVSYMLRADETIDILPGLYEYDVALYYESNGERVVKYYIGGKFKVLKAVTDALSA